MESIVAQLIAMNQRYGAYFGGLMGGILGIIIAAGQWMTDEADLFRQKFNRLKKRVDALETGASSSGEGAWTYMDISSPVLAAVAAPAATITGQQTTAATALAAIAQATGKDHLDFEVVNIQNTPGTALPTDATVDIKPFISFNNSSLQWTVTPEWKQTAVSSAAAIAAAAVGVYRATVRFRQRSGVTPS